MIGCLTSNPLRQAGERVQQRDKTVRMGARDLSHVKAVWHAHARGDATTRLPPHETCTLAPPNLPHPAAMGSAWQRRGYYPTVLKAGCLHDCRTDRDCHRR